MIKNKVVKNATWIIACKIIQAVLGAIVTALSTRFLQPSGYGLISYAASIVAFATPIMQLGLNGIIVQELVNHPDEEGQTMGTTLGMTFFSSLFCIVGVVVFVSVANVGKTETIIVCALYSVMLLFQAGEMLTYWFQAKLKSKYTSIVMLIAYFVVSAYKIILLVLKGSIYLFSLSTAFDFMIIAISLFIIYKKVGGGKLSFSFAKAKKMFSKSKYYILSNLMIIIFAQTDKIMLGHMLGIESTGFYSAAVTCATMTSFVFAAIIDSARPRIFENKKLDNDKYHKNLIQLFSIIIYLSLIQCIVMTIFAPYVIAIFGGEAYKPSIDALRIVVWYTTFSYMGSVRNIWLLAEEKYKYVFAINVSGAIMNVILNIVFIPMWGILGAAFASLVTQIFNNLIINVIIRPVSKVNRLIVKSLNPSYIFEFLRKRANKKGISENETDKS